MSIRTAGNGTQAALVAYNTRDVNTACAIAAENLRKPRVQEAVAQLLDAGGLSDRKLAEILVHYLALYASDDPAEKALGLRALEMAYRLKGSFAPERHRIEAGPPMEPAVVAQLARIFRDDGEGS